MKLKPGLIIALSVRTEGGVRNEVLDEKTKHEGSALVKEVRSRKTVADEDEFRRATETRSKARGLVRGCCVPTPFNILMCPKGGPEEEKLNARILEAETLIEQFNLTSEHSKLRLNMIRGEVAATDEEAAAAIRSELTGLLEEMQGAIKSADPKRMRDAASRGAQLGKLLENETRGKALLTGALKTTRAIASAVAKAGEDAEAVALAIADEKASPVSLARFAFAGLGDDLGDIDQEQPGADLRSPGVYDEAAEERRLDEIMERAAFEDDLLESAGPEEVPLELCFCPVCEEQVEPGAGDFCGACQEAGCTHGEPACDQDVDPDVIRALRSNAYARLGIPDDDLNDLSEEV